MRLKIGRLLWRSTDACISCSLAREDRMLVSSSSDSGINSRSSLGGSVAIVSSLRSPRSADRVSGANTSS